MNDRTKRSIVRFGKIFGASFLAIFVYLSKPLIDNISINGFSFETTLFQLWQIIEVATISGLIGAVEKYANWKDFVVEEV